MKVFLQRVRSQAQMLHAAASLREFCRGDLLWQNLHKYMYASDKQRSPQTHLAEKDNKESSLVYTIILKCHLQTGNHFVSISVLCVTFGRNPGVHNPHIIPKEM